MIFGDIKNEKKLIRINLRKGNIVNTILHEHLHRLFPKKPEKWINERAARWASKISVASLIKILKKYA